MSPLRFPSTGLVLATGFVLLATLNLGCIGFTAHLLNVIHGGHKIKAKFAGLEGKRVAVVCVANASSYGPNSVARMLERKVVSILRQNGEDIDVSQQDEVADWIDNNDWDQMDYREIGRGVGVDMVLAIDLSGVCLHEGRTLYRGRADVVVTVYDMTDDGRIAFREEINDFVFPRNGPRPTTELSEGRFRHSFVVVLAQKITKYFYDYHIEDDFATDTVSLET
jgi:hypothetical protein